jgi:hypothetical protein
MTMIENDPTRCPKCNGPHIATPFDKERMYPDFCSVCADQLKRNLYKKGKLEKMQKKFKVK